MTTGVNDARRTLNAVRAWAAALPAARYLISAIPAGAPGPVHRRLLTAPQVEHALGWLRWLNAQGNHIVARPWATQHILIDDLRDDAVQALLRERRVAASVESSPGSYQVWISVADQPLEPALAGEVARLLASRLGGDRGAANPVQPGRLPGFTNRKLRHQRPDGTYPFATLLTADGPLIDPHASSILAQAATARAAPRAPVGRTAISLSRVMRAALTPRDPGAEHSAATSRVVAGLAPGVSLDMSRVDFAIARRMLARGMGTASVVRVIMAGERAAGMHPNTAMAYARRTAEAAAANLTSRRGATG